MKQMATPYGVIGRVLGHSWSPQIHKQLGDYAYGALELEPGEVREFIREGNWQGLNVTMPYKLVAAEAADERSPLVERLGAANTLVRRADGSVYADNTDVPGFAWQVGRFFAREHGVEAAAALAGKEALVLGSGGAAQAVVCALEGLGATPVIISRSGENNYENLLERHAEAALVVNTTPVGMFPNCPASPLADEVIGGLTGLLGVLDIVYNPRRTGICLAAEKLGVPSESGLAMLVAQAHFASELFQGKELDDSKLEAIEQSIYRQTQNIVLIGMPGAGKTSCGKRLARALGRPFVDIDDAIATEEGKGAAQIIRESGEDAFREVETRVTGEYTAKSGLVIACGGGVVTRERNRDLLHQNGVVFMLDRPLAQLSSKGRPMSQAKGVDQLARERMDAYVSWADVRITCTGTADGDAALILRKFSNI